MHTNPDLIEQFKELFREPARTDVSRLREIYAERVVFRDPAREIRGLVALEDYFSRFCDDLAGGHFEYLDELALDNTYYLKWSLHFSHPRGNGRPISLRGISHLQCADRIEFHEDIYDPAAMRYDQLPRLGRLARWLKLRRAS